MTDLEDTITPENVEDFRGKVRQLDRDSTFKDNVNFPRRTSIELEPEINADRDIVPRCKITQGSVVLADNEDMLYEEKDFNETACGNAINEFESVVRESFR